MKPPFDTPRCDEFEAGLPAIPWSGNETEHVRGAILSLLLAWITMARGLERELATMHAATGISQALADKVAEDDDARPKSYGEGFGGMLESVGGTTRSGLAKSMRETLLAPPAPNRSHAPNPKNVRKKKRR